MIYMYFQFDINASLEMLVNKPPKNGFKLFIPFTILLAKTFLSFEYKSRTQQQTVVDNVCTCLILVLLSSYLRYYRFHQVTRFQYLNQNNFYI